MPKKAIGAQLVLELGEGTPNKLTYAVIRQEFKNLIEFFAKGGPVSNAGPITKVHGLRLMISYAISVDAPEETWTKLQDATKGIEPQERPSLVKPDKLRSPAPFRRKRGS